MGILLLSRDPGNHGFSPFTDRRVTKKLEDEPVCTIKSESSRHKESRAWIQERLTLEFHGQWESSEHNGLVRYWHLVTHRPQGLSGDSLQIPLMTQETVKKSDQIKILRVYCAHKRTVHKLGDFRLKMARSSKACL